MTKRVKRIGIYGGAFNPVHSGHIAVALQAMQAANLDQVYFLPERRPRHKEGVEHFGHRVAMLNRAIQPHPKFGVIELVDISFSVERTLPKLQKQFKGDELVFIMGSDVAWGIVHWPNVQRLLTASELVISMRADDDEKLLQQTISAWAVQPKSVTVFTSYAPHVSSRKIREALRLRQPEKGILKSVARYSDHHWLYVSVA